MSRTEEDKFISLQEAVKFCKHSQEYLSLRARQGKLKAVKFGRNWVIKEEWLEAYIANAENYKNNIKNNGKKIKKLGELKKIRKEVLPVRRIPLKTGEGGPPSNLPVGEVKLAAIRPIEYRISEFFQTYFQKPSFRFGFALAMVLVLMVVAVGFWGRDSLRTVTDDVAKTMLVAESKISEDEIYSAAVYDAADVFKNYFKWVGQSPAGKALGKSKRFIWQNSREGYLVVKEGYLASDRFLNEKYVVLGEAIFNKADRLTEGAEKIKETIGSNFSRAKEFVLNWFRPSEIPEPVKKGLVVIPSTEKDEEIKVKIKESFSDEVKVEPADKTSGTIIPVFREKEGDKYMYILVPIKN